MPSINNYLAHCRVKERFKVFIQIHFSTPPLSIFRFTEDIQIQILDMLNSVASKMGLKYLTVHQQCLQQNCIKKSRVQLTPHNVKRLLVMIFF